MKCPYCGKDNDKVVDSRSLVELNSIRRRRECLECSNRFTTYEYIDTIPLSIIKKDRRREPYNRVKIENGIRKACEKRPISDEKIREITTRIEMKLNSRAEREIESNIIGEMVMEELHNLDQVAYVRFASVYREFKDVHQFVEELANLLESEREK